jgi:uncharacterized protein (TIGR03083 family)
MDLPSDVAAIALRELGTIASVVGDLDMQDFNRPTGLPGWTLEDLVRHVTAVAVRQAESFHRARFAITEVPNDVTVAAPLERLPEVLKSVVDHTTAGVGRLAAAADGTDVTVPLPWAHLPVPLAAYVLLVEYGIHRYDIVEAATGRAAVARDVATAIVDLAELTLLSLAAPEEPPVGSIRFEPDGRHPTTLAWQSGAWKSVGDDTPADVTVRGSVDALALFITGRVTVDDPRLKADDPTGVLSRFKSMFPGP